ncbi:MAG: putative metalloprotease CJM1_0395 family protein [Phycisphaerales bacterium JB060]
MQVVTEATTASSIFAAQPSGAALPLQKRERSQAGEQLSDAEKRKLEELRKTDQRVRRHEEAHRTAAGALYRGGPNYIYETGPDGKRYAVAGSVQIDTSPGRTPEETIQKAARIRRAALAPTDPSGSDRAVASKATRMEDAARQALVSKSMSGNDAPEVSTRTPPVPPIRDDATEASNDRGDTQPPKIDRRKPMTVETLSPGDLGGEVWATVSALSNSAQLNQDRRADEMPTPTPHVDVMA